MLVSNKESLTDFFKQIPLCNLEIRAQPSCLPSSQLGHVCATSRLRPLRLIRISGDEWDSESLEKPVTDWPRHPAIALAFRGWTYWGRASGGSGPAAEEAESSSSEGGFFFLFFCSPSQIRWVTGSSREIFILLQPADSAPSWSLAERTSCPEETPERRREEEEEVCLEVSGTGEHWRRPACRQQAGRRAAAAAAVRGCKASYCSSASCASA